MKITTVGIDLAKNMYQVHGRTLQRFGHTVLLIAPQFVKPYVKTNKNDVADAEAICETVGRPNMRFVPSRTSNSRQSCRCIACARVL